MPAPRTTGDALPRSVLHMAERVGAVTQMTDVRLLLRKRHAPFGRP